MDENDEEILKFLTDNEEIYMDFDFIPEIASTIDFESRLISETTEPSPNFEPSETTKFETKMEQQKLWERQISELSSIIANYDPTKPAPPFLMYAAEVASWQEGIKNKDIRPRVQDQISKEWLLVDSGAQLSVWPRNRVPEAVIDPYISIYTGSQ